MNFPVPKTKYKDIIFIIRHRLFVLKRKWLCHPLLSRFYPKKSIYRRILAILLSFFILIPSILVIFRPSQVSADWFDDSYTYRQKISFTHNADITSERRVSITVDTGSSANGLIGPGKMQSDCDDTRFTDSSGKALRFQITSACSSSGNTTYDVIFPSIINGVNVGYVYYGNPAALSASQNVSYITALTPSGSSSVMGEEKAPAPVLHLKLDEAGSGSAAQDSSSYNNDGAISGASWQTKESCLYEGCLFFDGTDDVVTVTNADSIDLDRHLASAFTLETWINAASSSAEEASGQIFNKGTSTYLRITNKSADGKADLQASLDLATTDATLTITDGIELNKWTHIAMSYTDDSDDEITIYINGVAKGTSADGSGAPASDANNLLIGGATTANFHGFIDEFKIYNFENTASQIKTDAASKTSSVHGISTFFGDDTSYLSNSLLAYWKLDESSGNASDSSGNALTLTNNNSTSYTGGKFGNSGWFNVASSNYFSTTTAINNIYSVSFWASPSATTDEFINLASSIYITASSGTITAAGFTSPSIYVNGVRDGSISANAWNHIAVTTSTPVNANAFEIGRANSAYANGKIDDIRLYSRGLSPVEVKNIYAWTPVPAAWWKFDENTGTTANDSGSSGSNFTFTSAGASTGWTYQMPLTISNSGSALTDYQASVSANTLSLINAGKMQADCDDVRFYDSDNATSLNYWLESGCNSSDTRFWVKIPSIPNPSKTIYMRYGNPTVGAGSSGANTFVLFDDFSTNTLASYVSSGTWTYDSTNKLVSETNATGDNKLGKSTGLTDNIDIYAKFRIDTAPASGIDDWVGLYMLSATGTAGDSAAWIFTQRQAGTKRAYFLDEAVAWRNYVNFSYTTATWYKMRFAKIGTTFYGKYWLDTDAEPSSWNLTQSNVSAKTGLYAGLDSANGAKASFDDFRVRKYAATEPTATAGSETIINNASFTKGKIGSALKLNGTDNYIIIPDSASLSVTKDLTLESWIRLNVISTEQTIIGKWDETTGTDDRSYRLWIDSSNRLNLSVSTDGSAAVTHTGTTTTFTTNTWYHVAGVYNSAGTMDLYVNGALDAAQKTVGVPTSIDNNVSNFNIGAKKNTSGSHDTLLNGTIDDIRVYNYARDTQQIVSDMNAGHPPVGSPIGSAIGHWKFDEGYGATAHNSGNGGSSLNGTINSSPLWKNDGKFGKALFFNGSSQSVTVTLPTDPGYNNTISVWVYPGTSAASKTIITAAKLTTDSSSRPNYGGCVGSVLSLNQWTHIVAVSNGSGNCAIYQNGVQTATSTTGVTFGTSVNIAASSFYGMIDEVKLYNYALTSSEVKVEYNRGSAAVWGALSTDPDNHTASNSASRAYCPPGDSSGNCAAASDASPVGYWNFDERTGTTANDTSGNGNTGTLTGGPQWTTGKIGSALKFDGNDDYVESPNSSSLNPSTITITAWFNPVSGSLATQKPLVQKAYTSHDPPYYQYSLSLLDSLTYPKNAAFYIAVGGISYELSINNLSYNYGQWHHLVGTYDGETMYLYLDGKQVGSNTTPSGNLNSYNTVLEFGAYPNIIKNSTYVFGGLIDDVRVYSYARTPAQIAWDYNRGKPLGHWKFDENTGATARDASGNTNNGTLTGSPAWENSGSQEWAYQIPLTISNSGSALTDYQASVSANTLSLINAGKMQADCDDVRFYDSDNATSLNYWLESGCNSADTRFWVKIPSIPNPSKTIYMRYGNPSASAGSSGANTFVLFDNFDDNSIDSTIWTSTDSSGQTVLETGSELKISGTGNGDGGDDGRGGYLQSISAYNNIAVDVQAKKASGDYFGGATNFWINSTSYSTYGMLIWVDLPGDNNMLGFYNANGWCTVCSNDFDTTDTDTNFHTYSFRRIDSALELWRDGAQKATKTNTNLGTTTSKIRLTAWTRVMANTVDMRFDNIRVRKYASPEPTVSIGSERNRSSKFNSALKFDGTDDYVQITDTSNLRFDSNSQDYSLFAWVKRTTTGTEYIISKEDAANDGWRLMFNSSNQVDCSQNATSVTSTSTITDTNWHSIGCVIDRDGNGQVYIDGRANGAAVSMGSATMATTSNILIGARSYTPTSYFNGTIDDIRVYNYTLTPAQIRALYNEDSAIRFGPATGSP